MSADFPEVPPDDRPRPARIVRRARRERQAPAPRPEPEPVEAGFGLDPADLAGALLADLTEVAGQQDPFEFEMMISSFVGILEMASAAAVVGALPTDVVPVLIDQFESRRDALSLAVLATLAMLAEGEAGAIAARSAARLWQAGVLPPDWFEELDRAIEPEEFLCIRRDESDDEVVLLAAFRRAGRRHAFAVAVQEPVRAGAASGTDTDAAAPGAARAVTPLPAEVLPAHLDELVAEIVAPYDVADAAVERIEDFAEARRLLEAAVRARAAADARLDLDTRFDQWNEDESESLLGAPPYPTMVAALRNRIESMPPAPRDELGPDWDGGGPDGFEFDVDLAFPDFPAAFGASVFVEDYRHRSAPRAPLPGPAASPENEDDLGFEPDLAGSAFHSGVPGGFHGAGAEAELGLEECAAEPEQAGRAYSRSYSDRVGGLPVRRGPGEGTAPVYRLRIDLKGAKPPIWRRVEVPGSLTLADLHRVIQTVFEWEDFHLHVFETAYGEFGAANAGLGHGLDAEVTVEQVLEGPGAKLTYVYDYGDYWEHVVRVERTLEPEPEARYPRCTGGRRAAPPEDCGGLWEYEESLRTHGDAGADVFDREELDRRLAEDDDLPGLPS